MFNISTLINFLAKKKRRIFIPKFLYKYYWLSYCDNCNLGNYLGAVDIVVEYKFCKLKWETKKKHGFVYKHANTQDCNKNEVLYYLLPIRKLLICQGLEIMI